MKYLLAIIAIMMFSTGYGSENKPNIKKEKMTINEVLNQDYSFINNDVNYTSVKDFECSVTSTGTVETSNGSFEATLTVTGPCDSSLAQRMREAIATLRAAFK